MPPLWSLSVLFVYKCVCKNQKGKGNVKFIQVGIWLTEKWSNFDDDLDLQPQIFFMQTCWRYADLE